MSTSKRAIYSWDSCVIIAHFHQESNKPLGDIRAVWRDIENDKADLVLTELIWTEIPSIMADARWSAEFELFTKRPNVVMVNVHKRIIDKALAIRLEARASKPNIKTPDAIILATAIHHGVDVLHSFDPHVLSGGRLNSVYGLQISPPRLWSGQRTISYTESDPPESGEVT